MPEFDIVICPPELLVRIPELEMDIPVPPVLDIVIVPELVKVPELVRIPEFETVPELVRIPEFETVPELVRIPEIMRVYPDGIVSVPAEFIDKLSPDNMVNVVIPGYSKLRLWFDEIIPVMAICPELVRVPAPEYVAVGNTCLMVPALLIVPELWIAPEFMRVYPDGIVSMIPEFIDKLSTDNMANVVIPG